jgi:hypothetical protein
MVLIIAIQFMNVPAVYAHSGTDDNLFEVEIVDAFYTDLDNDYRDDDVCVLLKCELGYSSYYEFAYIIVLKLPSGMEYSYLVYVWAWIDIVYIHNLFYNHATETGDYTVYVEAVMVIPNSATDSGSYVFDPPGGSPGGKPTFAAY